MVLSPEFGRGEHADELRIFYKNQLIFYFKRTLIDCACVLTYTLSRFEFVTVGPSPFLP